MTLPSHLKSEAEAAREVMSPAVEQWSFEVGITWLFSRLCEMSEESFDEIQAKCDCYTQTNEEEIAAYARGRKAQHALDQAALLKARDEHKIILEMHKDRLTLLSEREAERARCERMEKALRDIAAFKQKRWKRECECAIECARQALSGEEKL